MKATKHKKPANFKKRLPDGQKSPRKLVKTAALLVQAKSQKEAARIENTLVNDFYGFARGDKKKGRRISREAAATGLRIKIETVQPSERVRPLMHRLARALDRLC